MEDGVVVCDEEYDSLLVRQTEEFNDFTRQLHHRDITPPPAPTAVELRHQMSNRDRKVKVDLLVGRQGQPCYPSGPVSADALLYSRVVSTDS